MSSYIYKEPSLKYKVLTTSVIISLIILGILGSFLLAPKIGYIPYFIGFIIILGILIFIYSQNTAYICKSCNHEFEISFWQDLITAHSPGKKMLKCPECSYKDYATELIKTKMNQND